MTVDREIGSMKADPSIEGSAFIAPDLARAATDRFFDANGWAVAESRPVQFMYRPGRRMTVRRTAWVEAGGRQRRLSVVAEAGRFGGDGGEAAAVADLPHPRMVTEAVRMWAFPHDPYLPDLHPALTIDGARVIAESMTGWPASVRSSVIRYRPGRRAVLRYEVRPRGQGRAEPIEMFVKIMRTSAADRVERVTRQAPGHPIISPPATRPLPGVLVFAAVPGADMRQSLLEGGDVPDAADFARLIEEFSTWADAGTPGPGSAEQRLAGAVDLLAAVLPHLADRLGRIAAGITDGLQAVPATIVHGDMHEGQVIIDPRGGLVVLDVDDIGPGDPVMDAGNALAHLDALAESNPQAAPLLLNYRSALRTAYLDAMGWRGPDLEVREAIAMLQLAGGPLRVLSPNWPQRVETRLSLAERALAN